MSHLRKRKKGADKYSRSKVHPGLSNGLRVSVIPLTHLVITKTYHNTGSDGGLNNTGMYM